MGTERPQWRGAAHSGAQRREHGEHHEDANDHREHGGILLGAMGKVPVPAAPCHRLDPSPQPKPQYIHSMMTG